jgi:putative FmdB family regulatory protein
MPTYEYKCKDCGEGLEVVQSFSDDALTECPACGGNLRKVFGSIGITFKGSGFYKNDSRSNGASSSSGEKSDKAEKSDSKTDTKTETKTDSAKSSDSSRTTDTKKPESKKADTKKSA